MSVWDGVASEVNDPVTDQSGQPLSEFPATEDNNDPKWNTPATNKWDGIASEVPLEHPKDNSLEGMLDSGGEKAKALSSMGSAQHIVPKGAEGLGQVLDNMPGSPASQFGLLGTLLKGSANITRIAKNPTMDTVKQNADLDTAGTLLMALPLAGKFMKSGSLMNEAGSSMSGPATSVGELGNRLITPFTKTGRAFGNAVDEVTNSNTGLMGEATPPTPAQLKGQEFIRDLLKEEGISPRELGDQLASAKASGLPVTALDAATKEVNGVQVQGRNINAAARALATMPGGSSTEAANLVARKALARQRLEQHFSKNVSHDNFYDVSGKATDDMRASAPAYETAFSQGPVTNDAIQHAIKNPRILAGIKKGIEIQRDEDTAAFMEAKRDGTLTKDIKPFDYKDYGITDFNAAGDPIITGVPNMRLLAAGKKGLSALIDAETNPVTGRLTEQGRALVKLKRAYRDTLYDANPDYMVADKQFSDPISRRIALDKGRKFETLDPEEIKQFMKDHNVSEAEKKAFRTGVVRNLFDKMDELGDTANPINKTWKQGMRKQLAEVFDDPKKFKDFSHIMDMERRMAESDRILQGSPTAPNLNYKQAVTSQPSNWMQRTFNFGHNPAKAIIDEGLGFVNKKLGEKASSMTNESAHEAMKHLLSTDPEMFYKLEKK